jgi:pyruvate kinase
VSGLLAWGLLSDLAPWGLLSDPAPSGRAKIVLSLADLDKIEEGDIVVTTNADSYLAPLLGRIKALVAEEGGLTSNAAIMGLNANIPVIVGARDASTIIKDGMLLTVDTPRGKVYKGLTKVL